ncbi:HEAT repeat [Roseospirillum parvum]|uniref:HEAT repeat n=2 Tax=Roseospirillum parvum TaxID=83401 RepID=A0A1G8D137_9PROT|nr:HEAT repeat [Roseospirillum parvum]
MASLHARFPSPPRPAGRLLIALLAALLAPSLPALAEAEAPPTATLIEHLGSPDSLARQEAIEALGQRRAPQAVEPLLTLLADPAADGLDRMAAAYALGEIGDGRAVAPLIAALDRDMSERTGLAMAAIPALGQLGDSRAVPLLRRALAKSDDHWLGRAEAARALGWIGDPSAVPDLLAATTRTDTRDAAIAALAAIGDPRGTPGLIDALAAGEAEDTRAVALAGLTELGAAVLPGIEAYLADLPAEFLDPPTRTGLRQVLENLDSPAARTLNSQLTTQ